MRPIQQPFSVRYDFPVHFVTGAFDRAAPPAAPVSPPLLAEIIKRESKDGLRRLLPIIDANVARLHPALIDSIRQYAAAHGLESMLCEPLILPGGEVVKNNPQHLQTAYDAIDRGKVCRHSFILAIGGGALLDLAGYAAATAHRGIRLIRLPTTVLSQNDSGVGVKNSINALGKKNFIGTFAPPTAVINDFSFLATLDQRDWLAGCSEAVKVALIKDAAFFTELQAMAPKLVARDLEAMKRLIYRCAELHMQHIAGGGDPFESGTSRPLDFGHWAAHKLEQLTNFELRHGEAVAIGIALDATYSHLSGWLSEKDWRSVMDVLVALNLPRTHPMLSDPRLLGGLEEFREHLGGRLTLTMLRGIGAGFDVHEIDAERMGNAINSCGR